MRANAQPARVVMGEGMALPRCDLIALDAVRLGKVGDHVFDKAARDGGREFDGLAAHECLSLVRH